MLASVSKVFWDVIQQLNKSFMVNKFLQFQIKNVVWGGSMSSLEPVFSCLETPGKTHIK